MSHPHHDAPAPDEVRFYACYDPALANTGRYIGVLLFQERTDTEPVLLASLHLAWPLADAFIAKVNS